MVRLKYVFKEEEDQGWLTGVVPGNMQGTHVEILSFHKMGDGPLTLSCV